ncbi:MAG: helix-turn-helix domain-containing protein [Bacteroidales bacterium]|nr:helix-turn-helix domain-containing protein [Bacteroidales bacterium]
MKIGIVLYPYCSLWSASGCMELLDRANKAYDFFHGNDEEGVNFQVDFISSEKKSVKTTFPYLINLEHSIYNCNVKYDLIIVPGFSSETEIVMQQSNDIAKWIGEQHNNGTQVASICTGSFLLALSGVLGVRTATTHWLAKDVFKEYFPKIPLDFSKILIDYGTIMMSGSATSFHNLIIHIIEKTMGKTVAIGVSKVYLIDINRDSPGSYMNLLMFKKHNDSCILKAQKSMENSFQRKFSLDKAAEEVSLSTRTFTRRFKKATNETPLNYMHKVKVEKAKEMLECEQVTFEEIAFVMGYEDVNAFRKIFLKHAGINPTKYRLRYQV